MILKFLVATSRLVTTYALGQPLEVTGIEAIHRNGQTFVTWKDVEERGGARSIAILSTGLSRPSRRRR